MAMRNRGTNWRQMAAEARTIADGMHDPDSKRMMLQIAEGYQNLAAYAERQATNARTEGDGGLSEQKNPALERTVESRDGTLPIGATGTVVHVYPGGHAYDLEFNSPFHTWLRWSRRAEDTAISDNPSQSKFERKNRIREWAYHIWKAAGRPDGYDNSGLVMLARLRAAWRRRPGEAPSPPPPL